MLSKKYACDEFLYLYWQKYYSCRNLVISKCLAFLFVLYIMDNMLGENKNLKDTAKDSIKDTFSMSTPMIQSQSQFGSYAKVNKLITALYMVTDTMDREEPIRLKLRTLGVEILSDINYIQKESVEVFSKKVDEILSFLNIASDIGMISEMNNNILKKEFIGLKESITEFKTRENLWLEEFISRPLEINSPIGHSQSKGHTRIGVQKGSTLLKALSNIEGMKTLSKFGEERENFGILKQQRRELILKIIKDKPESVSIKDISNTLQNLNQGIGGKTLQRELISMVKENVLKKTGEKRWSKYSIFNQIPTPELPQI